MSKGDWIAERKRRQKIDKVVETLEGTFFYMVVVMIILTAVLYVYMQIS